MSEIYLLIPIILIVYYIIRLPSSKGIIGESIVAKQLKKLDKEEYQVLNDVLLQTDKGSSQIDHIVISKYGIFVIETKYYSGWIHGNENSEYWLQTIYKQKREFRNPIKQNWAHIYAIKEKLSDFKNIDYYPIVVFTGRLELKNVYTNSPVIYENQLFDTIMKHCNKINLTCDQVKNIVNRLLTLNIKDKESRKKHIKKIKQNLVDQKEKEKLLICPRCGSDLVFRNGPYGRFLGCSNYPNCKYKKAIRRP